MNHGHLAPLLAIACAPGCAAGPRVADYPRRAIDRPYTLPEGVSSWSTLAAGGVTVAGGEVRDASVPVPLPLFWSTALTDDWTLSWLFPVLTHQILAAGDHFLGAYVGVLGMGWLSETGFFVEPGAGVMHRLRFARDFAFETSLRSQLVATGHEGARPWLAGLTLGVRWQALDVLALGVSAEGLADAGDRPELDDGPERLELAAPFGASAAWSFDPQWEVAVGYSLDALRSPARAEGEVKHLGDLRLTHLW